MFVTELLPKNVLALSVKPIVSELYLFSLTKRRLTGDLIEVFKIIKGIENIDMEKYFTIDTSNITKNNGYKIVGKRFQTNEAKHFFFNRVVNVWNGLPSNVIDCSTTEIFKKVSMYTWLQIHDKNYLLPYNFHFIIGLD